jgi:hypothetical protein
MKKDAFFDFFKLMKPDMQNIMKQPRYFISVLIAGLFFFISAGSAWSEQAAKSEEFFKVFSKGKNTTWFRGIANIEDGYAVCGGIRDKNTKSNWAYVIKIDKFGNTIWERELGKKARNANFHKVVNTRERKLVLVGIVNATPKAKWDAGFFSAASAWTVKLTADGKVEWDRAFQPGKIMSDNAVKSAAWAENVMITQNDEIIVLGSSQQGTADVPAIWKMDEQGKLIWNNTYKREDSITPAVLFPLNHTEFIASGTAFHSNAKNNNVWFIVFNDLGNTLLEKKYNGNLLTAAKYSNDGIIIAGKSYVEDNAALGNQSSPRIWLSEIDHLGNMKSIKYLEESGLCDITNMWISDKKEILVMGNTCESERERIWVGRLTLSTAKPSIRKFLPLKKIRMNDAILNGSDGFIAVGSSHQQRSGSQEAWVLRTKFNSDKYR